MGADDDLLMYSKHARPFWPSMFIAQDPQMPSRQERRNVKVGSISFLILIRASNTIGPHLQHNSDAQAHPVTHIHAKHGTAAV